MTRALAHHHQEAAQPQRDTRNYRKDRLMTVTPIHQDLYADPALAEEISAHAVDVSPMIRDRGGNEEFDIRITPGELVREHLRLTAYADAASAAGAAVSVTCPEIIREDGCTYMPDLDAIPAADWPRALLTAALEAAALRKALDNACQQFTGLLWAARGQAEARDPEGA